MGDTGGLSAAEIARAVERWVAAERVACGALLRLWRSRAQLTQADVAGVAGVHDSTISVAERGGGRLTSALVRSVAEACGPVHAPVEQVDALVGRLWRLEHP